MSTGKIPFRFAGRRFFGAPGDSVATALLRNGVRVFDRSIKQRRKRGPSCLEGFCMSCLLKVNDEPDVVSCRTPLEAGMEVKPQVAWPSPQFDLMSPFQSRSFQLFGPELYYRLFTKPAWAAHLWIRFLSSMSGRARLDVHASPPLPPPFKTIKTQVLIIGGGVAGIACAKEVCEAGLDALLTDRSESPGGWWARWQFLGDVPETMQPVENKSTELPHGLQYLNGTTVIGLYEDKSALAVSAETTYRIHFQTAIIASGCYPQLAAFAGSDEPLHLPVQGVVRAALETGWTPKSAVILDIDGSGAAWQQALTSLGVSAQLHSSPSKGLVLEGVKAIPRRGNGGLKLASGGSVQAEVICWSAGWRARLELLRQTGGKAVYQASKGEFMPILQDDIQVSEDIYAAGGCAGITGFASSRIHGQLVGATVGAKLAPSNGKERLDATEKQWLRWVESGGVDS